MVTILQQSDIAQALVNFFKISQPLLDTSPGSVARDLMIDGPSSQLAILYNNLSQISNLQSLRIVSGSDLDRLAQNFGAVRKTPTPSSGTVLFTFSAIPAVVSINTGSIVTASTGATFAVINGISVNPAQLNTYRATAIKYQNNLNFLNITDQYAVEVSVQATNAGSAGDISQYTINSTNIPSVSNVTNAFPFTGGADTEDDASFRNRVLAIFSGSNVGTALGYQNTALATGSVEGAIVVGPGNPLMVRDGSVVTKNPDGSMTIISEGTGGKVDVYILGNILSSYTNSYIYLDQSNTNNPANIKNNIVLGQIPGEQGLSIAQKRVQDIANQVLPAQPVQTILQVSGSISGSNFTPMTTDAYGRVFGNYELIKDTGNCAGSPWAQDAIHWVSNQITMYQENEIKSTFNGQDTTGFSDILQIPSVQQNISITNENSTVSTSDHSIITLLHSPASNVTRVLNTNTGERYVVINQNINGSSNLNTSGVIQISGNTLPAISDILQVDYTWVVSYDPFSDYDGKILNENVRSSSDSIDWGLANAIRSERILFTPNSTNTIYSGIAKHPVSYVVSSSVFGSTVGIVSQSTISNYSNRIVINLVGITSAINNITGIKLTNSKQEVYITAQGNGIIFNSPIVINSVLLYDITIILPTDTSAVLGDDCTIEYNDQDVFNITNSTGNFNANQITVPFANIPSSPTQIFLDVVYIASVQTVLTTGITSFPLSRSGNGFLSNANTGSTNAIKSNVSKRENQVIQQNSSNQLYATMSVSSTNFTMDGYDVVSVIDLTSGLEIWNYDYPGTVSVNTNGFYQLTFVGYNTPKLGDNVLIIYFADDVNNTQPFTFSNQIISKSFQTLAYDYSTNSYTVPINDFVQESGINFHIIDTTTGLSIGADTDGYLFNIIDGGLTASFSSDTFSFGSVQDLTGKQINLHNTVNENNMGQYSILGYNVATNAITIGVVVSNLTKNQVSIIRVKDGADLWSTSTCSINAASNLLELPSNTLAAIADEVVVMLFVSNVLHQAPTKLSITTSDQNNNTGKVVVSGLTLTKVASVIFSAIDNGLTQNLSAAITSFLGQNPSYKLPSNISLARVVQVQNVSVTTGNIVLSTKVTYDVVGTQILNNVLYPNEMIANTSLSNVQFILPPTTNNTSNAPKIGDTLLITFYYMTDNDTDSVYFTRNGTQYTNKEFALLNQIYIASGFNTTQSAKFAFTYFTQPATGSAYTSYYNYLAPQPNERISVNYNYNQLIANVTFAIENTRPITADVLAKAAVELLVDATVNIVVSSAYKSSAAIVLQNVQNAITASINTNTLGAVLNSSDLIVAAQSVSGVERSRILAFNLDGQIGQVLTLQAQGNQYFAANTITVNPESI